MATQFKTMQDNARYLTYRIPCFPSNRLTELASSAVHYFFTDISILSILRAQTIDLSLHFIIHNYLAWFQPISFQNFWSTFLTCDVG